MIGEFPISRASVSRDLGVLDGAAPRENHACASHLILWIKLKLKISSLAKGSPMIFLDRWNP